MFIDIDYNKRKKGYKIHLAKPNKQIITNLSESFDPSYGVKLGNVNELTFNIPYYIEREDVREKNKNVDLIREKMYIKIEYNNEEEWMIIDSLEDVGEGTNMHLVVNAFSNVYETRHKKLTSVELGTVNAEEYYEHILADTSWVVGNIDETFKNMYRTIEIGDSTVLESILEGGSTFGAILEFDSKEKSISLVDINKRSEYKGLKINYNNFLTSINRTRDTDSMATRLYVYGSEGLTIDRVNPTGMPYLEDFSYFLYPFERDENKNVIEHSHYMSDELAHAILDMDELTREYAPQIKTKQAEIDALIIELINQETTLNNLRFDETTIRGLLDIAKATGDTDLVAQRTRELAQAETLVESKVIQVEEIQSQIDELDRQIVSMQISVSVTSFTKELRDELNPFIIESDFTDDRYIDDRELYDDAVKKFTEAKTPNVTIDASIDNIIHSLEEEYFGDKIVLGDLARITDEDMNIDFKSLIIELTFNLDSNDCQVVIANEPAEVGGFDKILSILYDTQSTTSQLEASKHKWDSVTELRTEVDILRDGGIDAVKNRITAGVNESVIIGDRGIVLTNPDFPNELVIMQAGVIALSTDGGKNWSTSITPRGVIADTIIGKLIASNNLLITNDKGTFRIDSDGLTIDMDSIKIMSGSDDTPRNILDTWNQVILTMEDFANDNVLNAYEKSQIKKQWDSIVATHSSMVSVAQEAYGPETPENPYPVEYDRYLEAYESLNTFLNTTLQSDGHAVLDPNTMDETTPVDSSTYDLAISEYQKHKDIFQTVIPLDFAKSSIEVLEKGISLNYVRNGEVATQLNLSEEGVRIDGRLLEINAKTEFNDDLTMNAGVIKSKDNGIVIDLNAGTINLAKPLTINAVPVATKEDLDAIELQEGKSAYEIAVINGFTGSESQWLKSLEGTEGEQGIQGPKGESGEDSYIHVAWSDSADGTVGFTQNNSANKLYMGVYSNSTKQSSGNPEDYEWVKVKGDKGQDAPLIRINGETQIIKVDENGVITPSSTFTVSGAGINTNITSWTYSVDGEDFTSIQPTGVVRDGNTITISPSSSNFELLVLRASDGEVRDEFTIARTNDGISGKDAYTVLLSNESHTFAENSAGVLSGSIATKIIAYKGTTQIPVTINSVTGLPTGLTSSISQNNTTNATVAFTVNNSLTESSGVVQIRLEVEGRGMSKDFSYAIALKGNKGDKGDTGARGATGEQGPRGDQGTSVEGVTEWYLATSANSGVTTNTSGWSNTMQTMTTDKRNLWNYEEIKFSDGTTQDTIPVIIGVYGQTGPQGETGDTGRSILSIKEFYLASASASGITRTSSGWTTSIQKTSESKKYLWNYEEITWSSTPLTTYVEPIIIGVHGEKGEEGPQGPQGVSITDVDVEYAQNSSATSAPTSGWSTTAPTWKDGQYIWSRTKTNYSSGNPTYSTPACITGQKGETGAKGSTGSTGSKGEAGRGISSITEQYYLSRSKDIQFGGEWVETPPMWVSGRYMWTRSKIVYTNPSGTEYTTPVVDTAWEALEGVTLKDKTEILSGTEIYTDKADDDSVVHVEVDGKSVGGGSGKNRLVNTEFNNGFDGWSVGGSVDKMIDSTNTYMGHKAAKLTFNAVDSNGSTNRMFQYNNLESGNRINGVTSAYVKADKSIKVGMRNNASVKWFNISTEWVRVEYADGSTDKFLIFPDQPSTIWVACPQLEEGSTATAYEPPAPTPDYPIAINSFGDRNLLDTTSETQYNWLTGGETYPIASSSSDRKQATANKLISVNAGETLTFVKGVSTEGADDYWRINWINSNLRYVTRTTETSNNFTFVVPNGTSYLWASYPMGSNPKVYRGTDTSPAGFGLVSSVGKENLIICGKGDRLEGFFKNFDRIVDDSAELTLSSKKQYTNRNLSAGYKLGIREYPAGEKMTISYEIMYTNWDFPPGTNRNEYWVGQRFTGGTSESSDGAWLGVTKRDLPEVGSDGVKLNEWYKYSEEIIIPNQAHPSINDTASIQFYNSNPDLTATVTLRMKNVKLEFGEQTPYSQASEEAQSDTPNPTIYKTNLSFSEPLRSVGDVKDRLFRDSDGLWKIERNVGEKIFDGSEPWTLWGENKTILLSNALPEYDGGLTYFISSHFKTNTSGGANSVGNNEIMVQTNGNTFVGVRERFGTATSFKEWIKDNNFSVVYKKNIHVETLDQVQQQKLNHIQSYKNSNYVYTVVDKRDISSYVEEQLKPTLHATFKSRGWYDKFIVDEEIKRVNDRVDEKVDKDIFDLTLEELAEAKSLAMDAINSEEYETFVEGYDEYKRLMEVDKQVAEETLQRINDTLVTIENNLGDSSEKWNFIDTSITNSEGGVAISNEATSMSVVVGSDRISFFDGGVEVAFISDKVLQINHGIFVQSAQIGAHLISSLPENNDITVVQWVGF